MPAFSEDVLLPIVRADLRARRGPFYSHWVANDLAGADGSDYLKSTQSRSNVDSDYLASNEVMKAAHYLAGQTYHALYAPLAFGESLEWLDNKIRETKIPARQSND
jgi:hypothetical protein